MKEFQIVDGPDGTLLCENVLMRCPTLFQIEIDGRNRTTILLINTVETDRNLKSMAFSGLFWDEREFLKTHCKDGWIRTSGSYDPKTKKGQLILTPT